MRDGYEYIDSVTDLCLTTTEKGAEFVKQATDELIEAPPNGGLLSLLILVDQEYVIIKGDATITTIVEALNKVALQYGGGEKFTMDVVLEAFTLEYIGIRKVIWG